MADTDTDTDRALLEAAARAAGYKLHKLLMEQRAVSSPDAIALALSDPGTTWWDPLQDDGDALRLAVRLKIKAESWFRGQLECARADCEQSLVLVTEPHNGDPYAATRRAIVRAAAAMDKEQTR